MRRSLYNQWLKLAIKAHGVKGIQSVWFDTMMELSDTLDTVYHQLIYNKALPEQWQALVAIPHNLLEIYINKRNQKSLVDYLGAALLQREDDLTYTGIYQHMMLNNFLAQSRTVENVTLADVDGFFNNARIAGNLKAYNTYHEPMEIISKRLAVIDNKFIVMTQRQLISDIFNNIKAED